MTTATTYATRDDAIEWGIAIPIEESGLAVDAYQEYDLDAIADEVLDDWDDCWAFMVENDEFWSLVRLNRRVARKAS